MTSFAQVSTNNPSWQEKETVVIGIGEYCVGRTPMSSVGLGSCIGLILHDKRKNIGGMAHIMLASSRGQTDKPGKFADTAVEVLINELKEHGSSKSSLVATMVGGSCMFNCIGCSLNIGKKNIDAVKLLLEEQRISVIAEDTGGKMGRSVIYYPEEDGNVMIKKVDGKWVKL